MHQKVLRRFLNFSLFPVICGKLEDVSASGPVFGCVRDDSFTSCFFQSPSGVGHGSSVQIFNKNAFCFAQEFPDGFII